MSFKLDLQARELLKRMAAGKVPPAHRSTPEEVRGVLRKSTRVLGLAPREVHRTMDAEVATADGRFGVRVYWPRSSAKEEVLPLVLLYHGGGFVAGDVDTHDDVARYCCLAADVVLVSVDYRLAPEHKFPCAVEDSYAALLWAVAQAPAWGADPTRIGVTGDSAGGNLAAVVCQLTVQRGGPPVTFQALVCPVVEIDPDVPYPSRIQFGSGRYFLSAEDLKWFTANYVKDLPSAAGDPRASPIRAGSLKGLAPALIVTAGFDPLRDEAKHYADRLLEAGVAVEYRCFEGTIHGFTSFAGVLDAGKQGLDLVSGGLRRALHGK